MNLVPARGYVAIAWPIIEVKTNCPPAIFRMMLKRPMTGRSKGFFFHIKKNDEHVRGVRKNLLACVEIVRKRYPLPGNAFFMSKSISGSQVIG